MTEIVQSFRLANRIDELETIRQGLEVLVSDWAIPPHLEIPLNLALEEAFTNVVNYAFDDDNTHEIIIQFKKKEGNLEVTITDDGQPFDPTERVDPDTALGAEERPVGGLGIFLIKKIMDHVEYRRSDNKNQLILTKHL